MHKRVFHILALSLALCVFGSLCAGEADGAGKKRQGGPAGMANLLLQHADELGLTADQKAKLEDMAKGPMSLLTDDQKKKAKDIVTAARPGADRKAPEAKSEKKPEGDTEKKAAEEEKK